jgi:pyruvate/2-oxoacid:ferredoxin oxidoreductase beta subunit
MNGTLNTPSGLLRSTYLVDHPRFPFCKGCSHSSVLRKLNDALVRLQIPPDNIALVTDIGCIGLADAQFKEVHTVHTTHGRSTAFATGIALADSVLAKGKLKTIVLIGDGGAMIGLQHLVHAAMLNVDVTVLICNNFVYGMTGGQGSGLTPECFITATTPRGNIVPPADLCGILRSSNAPFVARAVATNGHLDELLQQAIAFEGFAAVEILELCTEYAVAKNELDGRQLYDIAERNGWELGVLTLPNKRLSFSERYESANNKQPAQPNDQKSAAPKRFRLAKPRSILVGGSAGERVQSAATTVCQAAIDSGLHVTQKNDNPVTQGSGFSLVEIWLSPNPVGFTGILYPDYVVVTSEDGLRELKSQGVFERLGPETTLLADTTLSSQIQCSQAIVLPLRKIFSPSLAAMGALALLIIHYRLLAEQELLSALAVRLANEYIDFMKKVDDLESSLPPIFTRPQRNAVTAASQ